MSGLAAAIHATTSTVTIPSPIPTNICVITIVGSAMINGIPYAGESAAEAPSSIPHIVADSTIDAHAAMNM